MLNDFRLEVFKVAAKENNYSRAARKLNITQPAVSANITELENMIGDKLFFREGNSMQLTKKGKILLKYTDRILYLYEMLNAELVPSINPVPEELKICANNLAIKYILPKLINNFKASHSNIKLTVLEKDDDQTLALVKDGEIDLGIICGNDTKEGLCYAQLAKISLGNSSKSFIELNFVYREKSKNLKLINNFILSTYSII